MKLKRVGNIVSGVVVCPVSLVGASHRVQVTMSPFFFYFFIQKSTLKKELLRNFFDLNKTRIFHDYFNSTFDWYIPSTDRESTGSSMASCDVVSGTLVVVAPVFTTSYRRVHTNSNFVSLQ